MAAKKAFTTTLDQASLDKLRDAAYWTKDETVSSLMEKGALEYVARLEAERGEPFPPREGEVKTGRPRKANEDSRV